MQSPSTVVLRAAVRAEVLCAGLGVTQAQADDIARRIIASDSPELSNSGGVRLASGETLIDALARHRQSAPHLFEAPYVPSQAADTSRAALKAMKPGARLEAANSAGAGVTAAWVRGFRAS